MTLLLADEFVPTGAYIGLAGYLICAVICIAIVANAMRGPATERDHRLSRVDDELRAQEDAGRARGARPRRSLDSLELFACLFAAFFVAGAYALISGGLV